MDGLELPGQASPSHGAGRSPSSVPSICTGSCVSRQPLSRCTGRLPSAVGAWPDLLMEAIILFHVARERAPRYRSSPARCGMPSTGAHPKERPARGQLGQQATKKKKKQNSRWTWGCWLSVERPPCKRPPEPWPLKDAIPPSPANGSRLAAQKLPGAGTADRGCDGAEASIRPGGRCSPVACGLRRAHAQWLQL